MKNPPHPGQGIKIFCLEDNQLSITEGAKVLGVKRQTLSLLINGDARINIEMAIRLEKAFGSTARAWLAMQTTYDLANSKDLRKKIKVKRFKPTEKKNPHRGSSFDDFLKEEGIYEECTFGALKKVLKWQIEAKVPNADTIQAMEELAVGEGKRYKTSEEMYKDLGI